MAVSDASYTPPPLTMRVTDHPGAVSVVAVAGEIDRDSAPRLQQSVAGVLARGGVHCLVVDLSQVDFGAAAGVRVLLSCHAHAQQLGVRMQIRGARGQVRQVLDICAIPDTVGVPA